jgi:hypothetical protein
MFDPARTELGFTSPGDSFLGEYTAWGRGKGYIVNMIFKEEGARCPAN